MKYRSFGYEEYGSALVTHETNTGNPFRKKLNQKNEIQICQILSTQVDAINVMLTGVLPITTHVNTCVLSNDQGVC